MADIRNTTRAMREDPAEPLMALAEGMATGSANSFIERQERDGQRELVNSDRLPSDVQLRDQFETLGFTFGPIDKDDPLFMPATLPPGWKRTGSDHAMWSYIADQHGRRRVAIFYKAAFYDRRAFMRLESLDWYVAQFVEYDAPPLIFDDKWATREAVLASMANSRDSDLEESAKFRRYATEEVALRDEHHRAECMRIAGEKEATAAKYEAAMKALADDGN